MAVSLPGEDTITFHEDLFLLGPATITLGGSPLVIDSDVQIQGPQNQQVTIDGDETSGVFEVTAGTTATIERLTISGGNADNGGGIDNAGTLTLRDLTLSNNAATVDGGGLWNEGTLTLANVTISGNSADGSGGGIYNDSGTLTSTNVTITDNRADRDDDGAGDGGGIYVASGTATLYNTIVAGNSAGNGGTRG